MIGLGGGGGGMLPIFSRPTVFLKKRKVFMTINYLYLYNYDMAILHTVSCTPTVNETEFIMDSECSCINVYHLQTSLICIFLYT